MNYIIGETKFKHQRFGEGILRNVKGSILTIHFPKDGQKRFTEDSILNGTLIVLNGATTTTTPEGTLRQYDSSSNIVGGKNVLEAFNTDDIVIFNESYTILGDKTTAKKISATYDLTVIGDIVVDEMKVNGELTVIGNITAKKLTCANTLICQGHIDANYIYVGSVVAKSVKCTEFVCDGNALIETTIDIDEESRTEKTMVACEGIVGAGRFAALNAIANEYFEFTGEIEGKVLELESDTTLSEITKPETIEVGVNLSDLSISDAIEEFKQRLQKEYSLCGDLDEESIVNLTKVLSESSFSDISDYAMLFEKLANISYQDKITELSDYLMIIYAKKVLPESIYKYETIEHIDTLLLPNAEKILDELEFTPQSVEHIAKCILMVMACSDMISIHTDAVLDKIFSSFGIRYNTVKNILQKVSATTPVVENEPKNIQPEPSNDDVKPVLEEPVDVPVSNTTVSKPKNNKNRFLSTSIHSVAKSYGITFDEQIRLASAKIKTCGDFLAMTENDMKEIFKKKSFLVNHLYQAHQKMKAAFDEMND